MNNKRSLLLIYFSFVHIYTIMTEMLFIFQLFVNGFARVLCMRGQVMYNENGPNRQRVANNSLNKDKKFKYDKVGYYEMQTEDSWKPIQNGIGMSTLDGDHRPSLPNNTPQNALSAWEADVKEIRIHLQRWAEKAEEKEVKERITREWRIVALVLDRLFFCLYLLVIIISVFTAFQRAIFSLFIAEEVE